MGNLFYALDQHAALGFSPFGIEDVKTDSQLSEAYAFLRPTLPVLAKAQAEKRVVGVLLAENRTQNFKMGGYELKVTPSRRPVRLNAGQAPMGADRRAAVVPGFGPPPPDERPFGLVISTAPDEFLVVGAGLMITFTADGPDGRIAEIGSIDEGPFANGNWVSGRRLNGDEGRPAIRGGKIAAIRVTLYRRD